MWRYNSHTLIPQGRNHLVYQLKPVQLVLRLATLVVRLPSDREKQSVIYSKNRRWCMNRLIGVEQAEYYPKE